MEFKNIVNIIMRYSIDRDTAENIAQDILNYHPCGDCAYYGECSSNFEDCDLTDEYEEEQTIAFISFGTSWTDLQEIQVPIEDFYKTMKKLNETYPIVFEATK